MFHDTQYVGSKGNTPTLGAVGWAGDEGRKTSNAVVKSVARRRVGRNGEGEGGGGGGGGGGEFNGCKSACSIIFFRECFDLR